MMILSGEDYDAMKTEIADLKAKIEEHGVMIEELLRIARRKSPLDGWLTIDEACSALKVKSKHTVRNRTKKGQIESKMIGGETRYKIY